MGREGNIKMGDCSLSFREGIKYSDCICMYRAIDGESDIPHMRGKERE